LRIFFFDGTIGGVDWLVVAGGEKEEEEKESMFH
jgi:hypothetical protein